MAPEQCAEGRDKVDSKVDVYSWESFSTSSFGERGRLMPNAPRRIVRQHLNMGP